MWKLFTDYFSFTKKERQGIFIIIAIIFILTAIPFFFKYFKTKELVSSVEFEKQITQLKMDTSRRIYTPDEYNNDYTPSYERVSSNKAIVFYFDPNTATQQDWIKLGIKPRTAQTIQKYLSKGGKFYKAEDIKKIWGISGNDAARLIPYVVIKKELNESTHFEYPVKEKRKESKKDFVDKIDINSADTSAFVSLPGIGSKLSKRIIAFREKLGGFYSIEQVGETYLLPDTTFQKIKKYLSIGNKAVKKININLASVNEMRAHPYIRYNNANAIFQYRQLHGNFQTVEELKKIMTITDDFLNKVSPYLAIE